MFNRLCFVFVVTFSLQGFAAKELEFLEAFKGRNWKTCWSLIDQVNVSENIEFEDDEKASTTLLSEMVKSLDHRTLDHFTSRTEILTYFLKHSLFDRPVSLSTAFEKFLTLDFSTEGKQEALHQLFVLFLNVGADATAKSNMRVIEKSDLLASWLVAHNQEKVAEKDPPRSRSSSIPKLIFKVFTQRGGEKNGTPRTPSMKSPGSAPGRLELEREQERSHSESSAETVRATKVAFDQIAASIQRLTSAVGQLSTTVASTNQRLDDIEKRQKVARTNIEKTRFLDTSSDNDEDDEDLEAIISEFTQPGQRIPSPGELDRALAALSSFQNDSAFDK